MTAQEDQKDNKKTNVEGFSHRGSFIFYRYFVQPVLQMHPAAQKCPA